MAVPDKAREVYVLYMWGGRIQRAKGIMVSYRIKRKEVAWKDVVGVMDKIGISEKCEKAG